jgi:hypothetical protein
MSDKLYHPAHGVAIDDTWATHVHRCDACRQFDATKPGTLALLCLEGSVLWKRENQDKSKPKKERDESYASPKAIKAAMRYK